MCSLRCLAMRYEAVDGYVPGATVRTEADFIAPYQKHSDVLEYPQARHFGSAAFIYLLIATTLFFYIFAPLVNRYVGRVGAQDSGVVWHYFMYSATMHVALTAIFYLDPAMFALMRRNRLRFMAVAPLAFVGVFWVWILAAHRAQVYFMLGYLLWTYWHFQKQHWGVYCFVRIHENSRPQATDRMIALYGGYLPGAIMWGAWSIISGENPTYFSSSVVGVATFLTRFGRPIVMLSMAAAGYVIVREIRSARVERRSIAVLSLAMLAFFSCNNWPFVFLNNGTLATAMVNTGHGLQYIVFMTIFAYDRNRVYNLLKQDGRASSAAAAVSRHVDARWLGHAVGALYLGGMFFGANWLYHGGSARTVSSYLSAGLTLTPAQMGRIAEAIGIAITVVHYILDAAAWKLTKPEARAVVVQKFDFLFQRNSVSGARS